MNPTAERTIIYGRALVAALKAFDTLNEQAGWFKRLQLHLLRTTYQQRLRHIIANLPSEIGNRILKSEEL
jgi:hypothetical protein